MATMESLGEYREVQFGRINAGAIIEVQNCRKWSEEGSMAELKGMPRLPENSKKASKSVGCNAVRAACPGAQNSWKISRILRTLNKDHINLSRNLHRFELARSQRHPNLVPFWTTSTEFRERNILVHIHIRHAMSTIQPGLQIMQCTLFCWFLATSSACKPILKSEY